MIIFFFFSLLPLLFLFHVAKKPIVDSMWYFNTKKHTVVSANVLKSKIYESAIGAYSKTTGKAVYSKHSLYCPIITVSYTYNQASYTTDLNLYKKGFFSPNDAITALYAVTDSTDFTFTHTFSNIIRYDFISFLTDFRISKTINPKKTIQLEIDPVNPLDNEFNHNLFTYKDYVPVIMMSLFSLILLSVPFLFPTLTLTTKIIGCIITIIIAICINYSIVPKLSKPKETNVPKFSVIINKAYDGTQLAPYFSKD
jgi:hypothetical protein